MVQNYLLQDLDELRKMFPEVDFDNEWELIDVQGWTSYEEGATYWLLENKRTNALYQLEDITSVMGEYEAPTWDNLFETNLADWLILEAEVAAANEDQGQMH